MDMPAIAMGSDSEDERLDDDERDLPPDEEDETHDKLEVTLHIRSVA